VIFNFNPASDDANRLRIAADAQLVAYVAFQRIGEFRIRYRLDWRLARAPGWGHGLFNTARSHAQGRSLSSA